MRLATLEIVLVRPETPANVGSVARACRNFGIGRLCIVGSPGIAEDGQARATAHGCEDLLAAARLVETLDDALRDHSFVVGTANRIRKGKLPPLQDPASVLPDLSSASERGSCAILFGCESRGLTDSDLARCTRLLRIPTAVDQPSLNISQAVLSVAQDCWRHEQGIAAIARSLKTETESVRPASADDAPPSIGELELLLRHAESLMAKAGFRPYAGDPESFRLAARRSLARGNFERRDLRTMLTILKCLDRLDVRDHAEQGKSRGTR